MRFRSRCCKILFCVMLALSSMGGAQLRPEEVEDLMHKMNDTNIVLDGGGDAEDQEEPFPLPRLGDITRNRR